MVLSVQERISKHSVSILNHRYRNQLLAAIAIQFLTFAHGIVTGWISPTLLLLQSDSSPTNFIISVEQVSWIGSLFGLGSMFANIAFGLIINRIGRKICMYLIALPYITAWILIFFSKTYVYLYVARFLNGVTGGGNYIVVSVFISEISDPNIRGALSSMAMLFLSFGMIGGFLLSSHVDYYLNPCIIVIFPILYLIAIIRFPETPQHLLKKQKIEAAYEAFRFYKNMPKEVNFVSGTNKQEELKINAEFEELKRNILSNDGKSEKLSYKDFVSREALKGFFTVFMILLINQLSGSFAFFNYMSDIFALSGTDIHPNTCTTIMGIVQTLGIFLAMMLSDRFGRKLLLVISTGGMAVGLIVFGLYIKYVSTELKLEYSWFPLVIMALVILVGSIGVVGLIFTIVVENLPAKIRAPAISISMCILSFFIFIVLKIFPLFLQNYGLHTVLFFCGGSCAFGALYFLCFLQETKGLYLDK